jgi:hypothetical protein
MQVQTQELAQRIEGAIGDPGRLEDLAAEVSAAEGLGDLERQQLLDRIALYVGEDLDTDDEVPELDEDDPEDEF